MLGIGLAGRSIGLAHQPAGGVDPWDGLANYWKFQDTLTDIAGANAWTNGGGVTFDASGKDGKTASFDGSSSGFLDLPDASVSFGTKVNSGVVSVGMWFNAGATAAGKYFLGCYDNSRGIEFMFTAGGTFKILVYDSAGAPKELQDGGIAINDNQWHFLLFSFNSVGSKAQLRVDDNLTGDRSDILPITEDFGNLNIGCTREGGTRYLYCPCKIDEFMIFDKYVTGDQATALYNEGNGRFKANA